MEVLTEDRTPSPAAAPPPPPLPISEKVVSDENGTNKDVHPQRKQIQSPKNHQNGDMKIQVGDIKKHRAS